MPRKTLVPASAPREKLAPSRRGHPNVSVSQDLYDLIDGHAKMRGCSLRAALEDLLNSRPSAPIPWDAIRDALVAEFGFAVSNRIASALRNAGMPSE